MADVTTTLKVLITAQNQTNAAFGQLNNSLNSAKTAVLGLVGALAGGLALRDIIDATRTWGNEVDTLRDQLGGTAEQMSALNFIGKSVGLTTEELGQTFGILNKRIADSIPEIAKGTSEFDKWGIKLQDGKGGIVGFDEAMRRIKTRFQEIGQGAQGTALLLDIFGRSGKTLSDFLALTDDQMKVMIQDAQNFGLILDGKATDAVERFNRDIYRLGLQFEGLKVQLGLFLIPLLSALIAAISKGLGFIKQLGEAIGRMLGPLKEWIDKLGGVKAIGDALLTIGVALLGLAALGGLIALITWLGRLVLLAAPLVAVAVGIALIAVSIKDIADTWNGSGDTWDKIIHIVGDIGTAFIGLGVAMLPLNAVAAIVIVAIGLVILVLSEIAETIKLVTDNWDLFVAALQGGKLNDIPVFGFFFEKAQAVLKWMDDIKNAWEDLQRMLSGQLPFQRTPVGPQGPQGPNGAVGSQTNTGVNTAAGAVSGSLTGALIGGVLGPVGAAIGSVAGALIGGASGAQRLASGGVIVGEAGPEAVIPLDQARGLGGTTVNIYVAGSLLTEDGLLDTLNDRLMGKVFSQRKLSF